MIMYILISIRLIDFIIKNYLKMFFLDVFSNSLLGGTGNHFFFNNESLTKFLISATLTKTVNPTDALIARPGAWSIESTNILLANDETYFVKSRSEDCLTTFSRLTFVSLNKMKNNGLICTLAN